MTVHQIEQFYIHVDTKEATKESLAKVKVLLIENNCQDFEFGDDYLVVDEFESHCEAEKMNEIIMEYLEAYNE